MPVYIVEVKATNIVEQKISIKASSVSEAIDLVKQGDGIVETEELMEGGPATEILDAYLTERGANADKKL